MVPGLSGGANRLGVAHEEEGQVENMHADVDQRSPSLKVFVDKDAPAGHASAPQRLSTGVVHVTEMSAIEIGSEPLATTREAALQSNLEDSPAVPRRRTHFATL